MDYSQHTDTGRLSCRRRHQRYPYHFQRSFRAITALPPEHKESWFRRQRDNFAATPVNGGAEAG